jgi:ribonuclease D
VKTEIFPGAPVFALASPGAFRQVSRAVIDNDSQLAAWLPQLRAAPWLALDTEADSLHAYPEKICLLQVSLPGQDVLIDPLAELDLAPLLEVFRDHELLMHGADYDLRMLRRGYGFTAGRIFDTMLAARLIGLTEFGLSSLVQRFLGFTLEKGPQKANWARRPLTERMEAYARNDTRHLRALVDLLRAELERLGRLEWHVESCAQLVAECAAPPADRNGESWRLKGSARLSRAELAVLREIWHWRENEAIAANRPPFFILNHDRMLDLAAEAARQRGRVPLPHHLSPTRQAGLTEAIRRALALPESEWPHPLKRVGRRLTDAQVRRADAIKAVRDQHAARLGIDPSLIAPRTTLLDLAHDWDTHLATLMRWQQALLVP